MKLAHITNASKDIEHDNHPSGKTSFDSVVGSKNENQMKSAPITNASKDIEYSPKKEGAGLRRQTDSTLNEVNDPVAIEVKSETVNVIHSALKLQDSKDKTPEEETYIELAPKLEYRPRVNLKDKDDLTMMVSNEGIHAETPALVSMMIAERCVIMQEKCN